MRTKFSKNLIYDLMDQVDAQKEDVGEDEEAIVALEMSLGDAELLVKKLRDLKAWCL